MDLSMQLAEQSFLQLPTTYYYVCPICGAELDCDDEVYLDPGDYTIGCKHCVSERCAGDYLPECKS